MRTASEILADEQFSREKSSVYPNESEKESIVTKRHYASLAGIRLDRRTLMATSGAGAALLMVRGAYAQDKPEVKVGSKDFTEQIVVAEMEGLLLEAAGYKVDRKLNLGGTAVVHEALKSGEIDTYVEYTGTGLLAILKMDLPAATPGAEAASPMASGTPTAGMGKDAVYDIVAREYKDQFNLVWLDPWGFNNTYALAVTQETATELGISKVSDLVGKEGDLTFGATQEFLTRPDGLPGIQEAYGLDFGDERGMDPGLVYQAVDSGDVDIISAFATDGRIPSLGWWCSRTTRASSRPISPRQSCARSYSIRTRP